MDLYKILPLKYARFLPPLPLLSSCIFHEDFQGSPEPSLKEPRAFPKVMHIHQCMWKLVRGTKGKMQTCPDFASPCSPAAAPTPGPASPHGAVHPFAVCAHCAWKNTAKPPSGEDYGMASGNQHGALCSCAAGTLSSAVALFFILMKHWK